MFKCDCGKEHDVVPTARLVEKNELIKELKAEAVDLAKTIKELEPAKAAAAELATLKGQLAERDAVSAAGFNGDAKAIRRAKALYNVEIEGMKDDEAPTFADWLADEAGGKAEPGLTAYFKPAEKAAEKAADKPADKGKAAPNKAPVPKVDTGAKAGAAPQGKKTAEDVRAYVASDTFQKLSPDQKRAKLAELRAEADATDTSSA